MLAQIKTQTQTQTQFQPLGYCDGEFDAAIGLPPQTNSGDYWLGYLNYTLKTGHTPF
ncbi:hypothetical protein [Dendronalium sp. ChiSLP03b]|uniref:hypothetical protein n=1 Tax=Dendronalium sp. ChiSLP03b TaxID=3075381 RepID=UPI002AD28B03|nr:hypothetical protein [Dendronalium sp. ChiSLP03b]MDZ8208643.1 hypothetical protein [Dendronalium sp. ChiSLP03b]